MIGSFAPFRTRAWTRSIALLVLLLTVRALVPAGFMATATETGLQLVFCDSVTTTIHGSGHHHHNDHAHPGATDPACPYAQSSGPAPLPMLPAMATDLHFQTVVVAIQSAPVRIFQGPRRQQTPRGPPALA